MPQFSNPGSGGSSGNAAHDTPDKGAPVKIGGIASVSPRPPVDELDRVDSSFDLQGKLRIQLYDHNGNPLSVQDGVALPAGNDHLLVGGEHEFDGATYHSRMRDDPSTPVIKRLMVEALLAPGSQVTAISGGQAQAGSVSELLLNAGSSNMVVDGSTTSVKFTFTANSTVNIQLSSLRLVMSASTLAFIGAAFGKGGGALLNGVEVDIVANNGSFTDELTRLFINEEFLRLSDSLVAQAGSTDVITSALPFSGTILEAGTSDEVSVVINDDLSAGPRGITYFTATAFGVRLV